MRQLLALAIVVSLLWVGTAAANLPGKLPLSAEGRFLYADDDDWDWASPKGAREPCRLSVYGRMPWSALDWLEEGLPEVRGVLVGTPPEVGNYLTMADLNKIRGAGPKCSYRQVKHEQNTLADLLRSQNPPNLVILMQDIGNGQPPLSEADLAAALAFVQRGGRLAVLDDWCYYRRLIHPFLDRKKFAAHKLPVLSEAIRKKVLAQVALLDHKAFRVREKATTELLKLGELIVPVLEQVQPDSLEQNLRLEQILEKLRPPFPPPVGNDKWLPDMAQEAKQMHRLCELKMISRDGNQRPGHALCLRLPVVPGVVPPAQGQRPIGPIGPIRPIGPMGR